MTDNMIHSRWAVAKPKAVLFALQSYECMLQQLYVMLSVSMSLLTVRAGDGAPNTMHKLQEFSLKQSFKELSAKLSMQASCCCCHHPHCRWLFLCMTSLQRRHACVAMNCCAELLSKILDDLIIQ